MGNYAQLFLERLLYLPKFLCTSVIYCKLLKEFHALELSTSVYAAIQREAIYHRRLQQIETVWR